MALAVVGTTTTMIAGSITQAWADGIPGTEGSDELIDSIGGGGDDDDNFADIGWPFNLTFWL